MEYLNMLLKYGKSFGFFIAGIGYLIKVILNFIFKKKEIEYNFFLNNRMKSIEQFLSDYNQLENTFSDKSQSYFYNSITTSEIDGFIVPLRYNLNNSLNKLKLYTSENEFKIFSEVCQNSMDLIDKVWEIKDMEVLKKRNKLSLFLDENYCKNNSLLNHIIKEIQKNIK